MNWKEKYVKQGLALLPHFHAKGDSACLLSADKFKDFINEKLINRPKKLFRYISTVDEFDILSICNGNILLKNREDMNDPMDGVFVIKNNNMITSERYNLKDDLYYKDLKRFSSHNDNIRKVSCAIATTSFSEEHPDKYNILWSHYANGGRGVCFEYDIEQNIELFRVKIHPIYYDDNLYVLNYEDFVNNSNIYNEAAYIGLCWKLKIWEQEKEWRYLNLGKLIFKTASDRELHIKQDTGNRIKNKDEFRNNTIIGKYIAEDKIYPSKIYFIENRSSVNKDSLEALLHGKNIEIKPLNIYGL